MGRKIGIKEFKEKTVGVPLEEIATKDILWCAATWMLIMGLTMSQWLSDEVLDEESKENYYGNVLLALRNRIEALGGKIDWKKVRIEM